MIFSHVLYQLSYPGTGERADVGMGGLSAAIGLKWARPGAALSSDAGL